MDFWFGVSVKGFGFWGGGCGIWLVDLESARTMAMG